MCFPALSLKLLRFWALITVGKADASRPTVMNGTVIDTLSEITCNSLSNYLNRKTSAQRLTAAEPT
jgi:hypothetical protein